MTDAAPSPPGAIAPTPDAEPGSEPAVPRPDASQLDAPQPDAPRPDASAPAAAQPDVLSAARDAFARHEWKTAFETLRTADQADPSALDGSALEMLALGAFFAGQPEVQQDAKERAFKRHEADGNHVRAAFLAADIARFYGYQGKYGIASAWKRRVERLIGVEGDTYAHGYLALISSERAAATGDLDAALALAERAVAIGAESHDADLTATAQVNLGNLKIATGATSDGLALMEEASIAAVNGDLSPFESGVTACRMIGACRDVTDYRRASEWIEATERYCDRMSLEGFPGICRIHRAEVVAVGGGWDRAEAMLEQATTELERYQAKPPQADGFYALGDVRRLRGDFDGAEAALREGHARGRSPQPALALIRLAQGNIPAAVAAIDTAVGDESWDRWARARLLPAQVEIALAAGHLPRARAAAEEMASIVSGYPSPAMEAACRVALGRVLLAEGDVAAAAREVRMGLRLWREVGSPYEVARSRVVLSRAVGALGDDDDADLELGAAIEEFRRLGARVDLEAAERELGAAIERRAEPRIVRKTFMFTDIVDSTGIAERLGDRAWDPLIRWHDEMLRTLVDRGGGEIVKTLGDGVFAAFDDAGSAIRTAIAIQEALRTHDDPSGVSLSVRIGLHEAEASQRGGDYIGIGVNVAARVGGLASGAEILASAETLAAAGDVDAAEPRTVAVKGVTVPIRVAAVAWG
jgi:class 3 adenylate cyclase